MVGGFAMERKMEINDFEITSNREKVDETGNNL